MRGISRMTLAAFALLLPMACSAPGSETPDSAPIADAGTPGELVTAWVEMWNAYDLDRVPDLFLNDDRVSYFSSEFQGVIQGFGALVAHHEGFGFVPEGDPSRGTRLWVEDLTEDRFGDAAVLTGIWYFGGGASGVVEEGADLASWHTLTLEKPGQLIQWLYRIVRPAEQIDVIRLPVQCGTGP